MWAVGHLCRLLGDAHALWVALMPQVPRASPGSGLAPLLSTSLAVELAGTSASLDSESLPWQSWRGAQ